MAKEKNEETAVSTEVVMDSEEAFLGSLENDARGEATAEEIRGQMGSVEPRLERIEIKHSGACMFVLPGGDPVQGDKGFKAVVLASNFHNAKYAHAFDDPDREADERPECKSSDGVTPDAEIKEPKCSTCSACPLNCQATNQQARDAAFAKDRADRCQNRLALVVQLPGHAVPYIMELSPRSFKHFAGYAQRVGSQTRFLLHEVATEITLKKAGQFGHSEAQFKMLGALPEPLRKANAEANVSYLAYLKRTATMDRVDEAEEDAKAASGEGAKGDAADAPL